MAYLLPELRSLDFREKSQPQDSKSVSVGDWQVTN